VLPSPRIRALPRFGIAVVRGRSMTPTLHDGDRLLVRYGAPPRPGAIAIVRFPDGVVAVKRLDHQAPDGWWVARDNPVEGRDSWSVGAVAEGDVLAVAWGRVWPRPGPLPGAPGAG
jgi:SOS-response transcriptional repressor LexA